MDPGFVFPLAVFTPVVVTLLSFAGLVTLLTVRSTLVRRFLALAGAKRAAEAHRALGGEDGPLADVVSGHEASVEQTLEVLRELHVAVATRGEAGVDLPQVQALVGRLQAEREVDEATLKHDAALRARGQSQSTPQ
ncbi:MAG: hypothetical protein AAGA48_39980 [Myxococcota bacterium]